MAALHITTAPAGAYTVNSSVVPARFRATRRRATYTHDLTDGGTVVDAEYALETGAYTTGDSWMMARAINSSGTSTGAQWIKVVNGWDHFASPTTAEYEWGYMPKAWVSTTSATTTVRVIMRPGEDHYLDIQEGWYDVQSGKIVPIELTPEQEAARLTHRLREILGQRAGPHIITSKTRQAMKSPGDIREERARETLRRVIGEQKFRNFLKTGFVSVKGKSGLIYQIFPGHGITAVYNRGNMVERLCVVLTGNFPPTDSLIMRYIMILNNEDQFRSFAVKHGVYQPGTVQKPTIDMRPLPEIYSELKGQRKIA